MIALKSRPTGIIMGSVGLAVDIVGLVGLFNTCLDLLDMFNSWRDCGSHLRLLVAEFQAQKLRFENWGHAVGFEQGALSDHHSRHLDNPCILWTVQALLLSIRAIFEMKPYLLLETQSRAFGQVDFIIARGLGTDLRQSDIYTSHMDEG